MEICCSTLFNDAPNETLPHLSTWHLVDVAQSFFCTGGEAPQNICVKVSKWLAPTIC